MERSVAFMFLMVALAGCVQSDASNDLPTGSDAGRAEGTTVVDEGYTGPVPQTSFEWTPLDPEPGETVRFLPSVEPQLNIEAIHWDFDDGTSSTDIHPEHAFRTVGNYTVNLTMQGDGWESKASGVVDVGSVAMGQGENDGSDGDGNNAEEEPVQPGVPTADRPYVVVATFDTGANPFHPAWRSDDVDHPSAFIPGYPSDAVQVSLQLGDDLTADWDASQDEWQKVLDAGGQTVSFPGTRIIAARASSTDPTPIFDASTEAHSHGAKASSQIAGTGYSVGDNAFMVIMDHDGGGSGDTYEPFIARGMDWINQQSWIDIIHVNMAFPAPYPMHPAMMDGFVEASRAGKLVVLAAGNGLGNTGATPPYPMELQHTTGAPTTLVAGANDQCLHGAWWANLNPHVVMDGAGTIAASDVDYGSVDFAGTSSASPRTAGYAAELLYRLRVHFNDLHGARDGAMLVIEDPGLIPGEGPLADGRLTAPEFHELIRKTAQPPHDSELDGDSFLVPCVAPSHQAWGTYLKEGYGEVSEHTIDGAFEVAIGAEPMPERPMEDLFYDISESYRQIWYDTSPV